MAVLVTKIIAAPIPCTIRERIRKRADGANAHKSDAIPYSTTPTRKTRFRPYRSANRPIGTMQTTAESRYAVVTQLRENASRWNSLPVAGRATLTEVAMYGVRNEEHAATNRATRLSSGAGNGRAGALTRRPPRRGARSAGD